MRMSSDVRGLSQQWMAYSAASFGTPCPRLAGRAPCGAGRAPCGVAGPLWGWQGPVGWQSTLWGWQGPCGASRALCGAGRAPVGWQGPVRTTGDGPVHLGVGGLVQDAERGDFRRRVQHCIQCSHKETCGVQENVHSMVKLRYGNAHSPLIHYLGKFLSAAQVRTNELWENKQHNQGEHKVFPEELLWDLIFWSSKRLFTNEGEEVFWDDPCGSDSHVKPEHNQKCNR